MDEEKKVSEILPPTEILAQMSEEFSEGAQAALKLRRALDGTNPTPKTIEECWEKAQEKYPRWKKRLSERKNVAVLGWPVCQNWLAAGKGCPGCPLDKPTSNDGDGECRLGVPSDWDI